MANKMISLIIITLFIITPVAASNHINQTTDLMDKSAHVLQENAYSIDDKVQFQVQHFSIKPQECKIQSVDKNKCLINIDGCGFFHQPDLPILPMKTVQITLPLNATIDQITLSDFTSEKIASSITLTKAPRYYLWSLNESPFVNITNQLIDENIQHVSNQNVYPGINYSYVTGKNNECTTVQIYLFPIQYNLKQKDVYLFTAGTINISYTFKSSNQSKMITASSSAENIIITPLLFYLQAKKLKEFHDSQGIPTIIVNTTWIKRNFDPVDYPDVQGYKDFNFTEKIRKYDDKLARKIIAFLRSQSSNPNLKFVTLLGSAQYVPPSYYFGDPSYPVPTDYYYGSPDLDLITNYHVGRLPANSIIEAAKLVNKIINWNPTPQQMQNVAVAGGIPFASPFMIGELITTDSINHGYYDGLSVDKYFRSDNQFTASDFLSTLKGDYGLLYIICHGNSRLIACEDGRISPLLLQFIPKTTNTPIVSCIACSSGSYDTHVIKQSRYLDKTSFAEALLLSKGGGIAYIGGARTNDGYPLLTLNKGRLETYKETYMAGLLSSVSDAYGKDYSYLGELTTYAKEAYIKENAVDDFWNLYHLYGFVLLGDPALKLSERKHEQASYNQPQTVPSAPVGYKESEFDYEGEILYQAIDEITQYFTYSDSPEITEKQINIENAFNPEIIITTQETENGKAAIIYKPTSSDLNLIRVETVDGKEDWIYSEAIRPVDDDYSPSTPGYGVTRWASIQEGIDNANPSDTIYVFNGTYYENIFINSPRNLVGEHWKTTIIDGRGTDDVVTIQSNACTLSGFTIQHCGNRPFDAGITIIPQISLSNDQIIITDNHITNNKNCGMYINNPRSRFSSTISIEKNSFSNNNYAIYQSESVQDTNINHNYFVANNYGLYLLNSNRQNLSRNIFENNYVGLFMNKVNNISIVNNNFIDNIQHSQFSETINVEFNANYWDNWIGLKLNLPVPKLINGYYTDKQTRASQMKLDRTPSDVPFG